MDSPPSGLDPVTLGIILVLLILVSAFFASAETALLSFDWLRLRFLAKKGDARAKTLKRLLSKKEQLIGTILVGNNLVNIAASSIATALAIEFFGDSGIAIATGGMTLFLLIFGEISPKTFASRHVEKVGLSLAGTLSVLTKLLWPVVILITALSDGFLRLFGGHIDMTVRRKLSEEEVRTLIAEESDASIPVAKRMMLHGIFQISRHSVKEVMVPRTRVVALDISTSLMEAAEKFVSSGLTRMPVFGDSLDRIIGVVHARDVLALMTKESPQSLASVLRETFFVPESMTLETLLFQFQSKHTHIAMVVDEYGSFEGIVTLEDVLEEIVGEIRDEHDIEGDAIRFLPGGDVFVRGTVTIRDVNKALGMRLPTNVDTTLGGFMMTKLGHIPNKGESFVSDNARFSVERISGRRIVLIRVSPIVPPDAAAEE
jgi:Mg2+/Co2+ transporter CorB